MLTAQTTYRFSPQEVTFAPLHWHLLRNGNIPRCNMSNVLLGTTVSEGNPLSRFANEILVVMAYSDGGRPNPRVGKGRAAV